MTTTTKESPYRRPYKSRRRRREATTLEGNKKDGKMLLRLLGVMVLALILAIALIFKGVGKSQVATASPTAVGAQ